MNRVFLSHSSTDKDFVRVVAERCFVHRCQRDYYKDILDKNNI